MQESPFKVCPICEAANNPSADSCHSCGARFSAPQARSERPVQKFSLKALIIGGAAVFLIWGLLLLPRGPTPLELLEGAKLKLEPAPSESPLPNYRPKADEQQSRTAPMKGMPKYAQVSDVANKLGFRLSAFKRSGDSGFLAEATQFIGGREFKFVVMGPASDRADTIRIQAWGFQTKQARQQLERWATEVLSSLNRGQLPRDSIRQLYAGANVGDGGVSNGYCNIQVLQRPSNPGTPSANDRITIDLIFHKTD